jgi:uncharacterized protein DUF6600/FecR-like protein
MKRILPSLLTLSLLVSLLFISGAALAQTDIPPDMQSADVDVDVDDSAPVSRVARLSFVDGDVSFLRAGVTEWAPGVENLPLLAGDHIYTGRGGRAEVQLARGNYIRLSESTELTISDLSETAAQFEITEGTAIIRIERLATVFRRFEVDTPNSAILVQKDGLYRVDVRGEENSELVVRNGEAEVSTDEGTFKVRESYKLLVDTTAAGRLELAVDNSRDDWDRWSYDRDTTIARINVDVAPDYVANYESTNNDLYGVSDLSSYGTWTNYSSYGQCWIPRVGSDWAPYRSGQWLWIPAAGWTWLSSEPWGWAPYHYGRWSYLSGLGWAWIPGFGSGYRGYGYRDYHWRPALVYFFNSSTPRGNYVGWYPLGPGERWRRHDHRRGNDQARSRFPSNREGWRRPDDGRNGDRPHHGITILPADGFARGTRSGARPSAPTRELSEWINKGSRSGLPDMKPSPVASAPVLAENDGRRSRRIAVPANEVMRRPVVTRNPKVDPSGSVGIVVPRERRVITPRNPEATQGPILREHSQGRSSDRRPKPPTPSADSQNGADAGGQSPKTRVHLPVPSEKTDGDDTPRARKRAREGDPAAENPTPKPEPGNPAREERRRARQEQSQAPKPVENNPPANHERDNETRSRDRRPPTSDTKPREDAPPRSRAEEPAKSHERSAPAPRVEPKQERPQSENQVRSERQQEKGQRQERPQQQQEQRKKP